MTPDTFRRVWWVGECDYQHMGSSVWSCEKLSGVDNKTQERDDIESPLHSNGKAYVVSVV